MKKRLLIKYFIMCMMLILVCGGGISGARADQISDLEDEVSENEKKYDKIQKELDELEKAKDNLEDYIAELNDATAQIEAVLEDLEDQIQQKDNQIKDAQAKIAVIDKKLEAQYENMKLRIKYLYESNDTNYMDVIFSSENIGQIFERMEYVSAVTEYDKKQMDEYKANLLEAKEIKAELENEKVKLDTLLADQEEQRLQLEKTMDEAKENIATHKEQIEAAIKKAEAIEEEIEADKNTIEKLKEEEERRKQEEERRKQELANGTVNKIPYQQLEGDIKRMAAIIWCEARGESYEGQVAVGTVVMNRVESPRFPNTIEGVISQNGQFSPYKSGKYAIALSMENMQQSCVDAAIEVIEKGTRLGPWLFFRMKNGIINGTFIGCHVFY
ncbi:MAG: cell wall hydrolase [Lachnospiraceae bacterium]|nr:cell wall hydrolase [Lachnospiraceae bacterium]